MHDHFCHIALQENEVLLKYIQFLPSRQRSIHDMAEVIMHMDILQVGQLEMRLMQIPRGIIQVTSQRRIMHIFIPI